MSQGLSPLSTSLLLSCGSLLLAASSMALARRVNYVDHLPAFNAMAAAMLALCAAALIAGVVGTWKSRGRSLSLWLADAVALLVLGMFAFNP